MNDIDLSCRSYALLWMAGYASAFGPADHGPIDTSERQKAYEAGVAAGQRDKATAEERAIGYAARAILRENDG